MYITRDIRYVGVMDRALDLFEGQYPVPDGMAYNSYVIEDEHCAVVDSVEVRFAEEWIGNIRTALQGRSPDYLIVQHMEPDHSGSLLRFLEAFPGTQLGPCRHAGDAQSVGKGQAADVRRKQRHHPLGAERNK